MRAAFVGRATSSPAFLRLLDRYQQSELQHARWAMLGVAGILVQEITSPNAFWYESGLPQNLPGPFKDVNMGGLLAFQFCMMHVGICLSQVSYKLAHC